MLDLAGAVSAYSDRFHARLGEQHHVASPLGAWLLIALAAPAAAGEQALELADVLGMNVDAAYEHAVALLTHPHPEVASAVAAWRAEWALTPQLSAWLDQVAEAGDVAGMPDQAAADAWADTVTGGLIPTFPLTISPATALILATALATDVAWDRPFDVAASTELGGDWAGTVHDVLKQTDAVDAAIVSTDEAGDVAVHTAHSTGGLRVVSVIADPSVPARDVLAAAHRVAAAVADGGVIPDRVSLFDLPTDAANWTIEERTVRDMSGSGRIERFDALLPAWSATDRHELTGAAELGFPAAAAALTQLLPPNPDGYDVEAVQSVLARFHRTGFQAAAVTAMSLRAAAAMLPQEDALERRATLRFAHPYAVVAVIDDRSWAHGGYVRGPWHGVPVFSAWVATPDNAE